MHTLATAILEHTTDQGVHHDWLIEDPSLANPYAPDARLWTARFIPPPTHWPGLGCFELEVLPPHRRAYLTYQGPVRANRGRVRRVASGLVVAELWSAGRMRLFVRVDGFEGIIDTQLEQPLGHLARVEPAFQAD
ncbi:MAG: hypothetical protein AAGC44_08275 [Planctomycetota bacterium]